MNIPQDIRADVSSEYGKGPYPLIEIQLNGKFEFEKLLTTITDRFKVPYKILKADIEYVGKSNYGKLILKLQGSPELNESLIRFFKRKKIKNRIKNYV
ncbi:MAG: NIL domain-containing protein [Taibaiella sp.]|nr:NIL domain-containing protein [Taibaiella sp.]